MDSSHDHNHEHEHEHEHAHEEDELPEHETRPEGPLGAGPALEAQEDDEPAIDPSEPPPAYRPPTG
jgi:hypothetical protein